MVAAAAAASAVPRLRRRRRRRVAGAALVVPSLLLLLLLLALFLLLPAAAAAAASGEGIVGRRGDEGVEGVGEGVVREEQLERRRRRLDRFAGPGSAPLYLWSTGGGGLRSMTASMGFANLFAQVYSRGSSGGRGDNRSRRRRLDRLGSSAGAGSSEPLWMSNFYSVTSSNEASWFALQYFYSDAFHDEINGGSPQRLEQFATDWLDVYLDLNSDLPNKDSCQEFQDLFGNGRGREMRQQCDLLLEKYQGDWTLFVQDVLKRTSSEAYGDPTFYDRSADHSNRVWLLDQVNLFVQATLMPVSRIRGQGQGQLAALTPPMTSQTRVLSTGIPATYSVRDGFTSFYYALLDQQAPLNAYTSVAPGSFTPTTYGNYFNYPASNGNVLTNPTNPTQRTQRFSDPFYGNAATVTQAASISSADHGILSGLAPSALHQYLSVETAYTSAALRDAFYEAGGDAYDGDDNDDLAVCTQWPDFCGTADGRFLDGRSSDGFGLASTIGQYHQEGNSPSGRPLRIVLTNTNYYNWNNARFRSYFDTDFNANVEPGAFIWPPDESPTNNAPGQTMPWRSPQIFGDSMSEQFIRASMIPVSNYNYTYYTFTATTIDNSAFGVKRGQQVSILYIRVNSGIPTTILGRALTNTWMDDLAELPKDIANNDQLYIALRNFLDEGTGGGGGPAYCQFSPDYNCYRAGWPACCVNGSPSSCPPQQPACDAGVVTDYCTYAPDDSCYKGGWPECCLTNNGLNCPSQQPPCDLTYCDWEPPEYDCYRGTGYPTCCSNPPSCPKQQPPCDNLSGGSYCTFAPDRYCYPTCGWPTCCCTNAGANCPRDQPPCEV